MTFPQHTTKGPPARMPGQPWSILDASQFLGISHRHLARLIDAGKVPSFQLGRRRLIADSAIQAIAAGQLNTEERSI